MLPNELIIHIYKYMDIRTNMIRVFPWLREIDIKCDYCENNSSNFLIRHIRIPEITMNETEKSLCGTLCKNFNKDEFTLYHFYDLNYPITLMFSPNEDDILFKMKLKESFLSDKELQKLIKKFLYEKEDKYLNSIIREFYRKLPKKKREQLNLKF